jgi:hypothetical protein
VVVADRYRCSPVPDFFVANVSNVIFRGELKGCFTDPRHQSNEQHPVSSMAGIGLAFRQTEIRLWAPSRPTINNMTIRQ